MLITTDMFGSHHIFVFTPEKYVTKIKKISAAHMFVRHAMCDVCRIIVHLCSCTSVQTGQGENDYSGVNCVGSVVKYEC
jgi:hypothetical protein